MTFVGREGTSSAAEKDFYDRNGAEGHIENLSNVSTYYSSTDIQALSKEHREYLLHRHGTLELDPIPSHGDADPYNWSQSKKNINLLLVAFHAMMATFTASSIQSAFENIAADLHQTLQTTTYLTSLFIAILGFAPLFWQPISKRYGRRPVFLLSLICSGIGNIGCACSHTYATMAVCRAITAFFISPAAAIGSGVVKETYFKKERAKYMGIWTLLVTLGVPAAPFIFGFVALRVGYRWIYWILSIINAVQFVLYLLLGPETRYLRKGVGPEYEASDFKQEYLHFARRIDPSPMTLGEFLHPFTFFTKPTVFLSAIAYSMIFCLTNVMVTVEIPTLFGTKFAFNTQQLGLQFLGTIIGSVIGEQISNLTSDRFMARRAKKNTNNVQPSAEYRLWLAYPGIVLGIVGVIVFLVQIANAKAMDWNVSPIIGAGIAAAGNQIVTTMVITYCVDCYVEDAAVVGVFITLVRQTWGFIGPFWFPQMFENCGLYISAVICTVLMVVCSLLPTVFVQWKGRGLRKQ